MARAWSLDGFCAYAMLGAMHIQNLAIVKALVCVAWADGRVAAEEMEVIEALLNAYQATPSEVIEVKEFARVPRKLEDIELTELAAGDRRILLQHSVLITFIDGEQSESERELIEDLKFYLRIPPAEAERIATVAEQRAKQMLGGSIAS